MHDVRSASLLILFKSFHGRVMVGAVEDNEARVSLAEFSVFLNGSVFPELFGDSFKR